MSDSPVMLVAPDGTPSPGVSIDADLARTLYRDMVMIRRLDVEGTALQRQGELGIWAPSLGQEASVAGSARALHADDMAFPTYREHGVALVRGVPLAEVVGVFRCVSNGGWDPLAHGVVPYTIVIADQCPHAVGYAMGIQHEGAVGAAVVYLGDGATSEGDVHEAMTFAAVYEAPVVFFCQNNQWAISEPLTRQTRVPLVRRAAGYGMPGVSVDGNDALAVHSVVSDAIARAHEGGGPTFIESVTYRMGAHTTSDDPTRYRPAGELDDWAARDPIARLDALLRRGGLADDAFFDSVAAEADSFGSQVRDTVRGLADPPPSTMLDHAYAEPHPLSLRDRATVIEIESMS